MKWAGHVGCMGEKGNAYRVLVGNFKETDHYKDLEKDWGIKIDLEEIA
jgi:hypothetical protein